MSLAHFLPNGIDVCYAEPSDYLKALAAWGDIWSLLYGLEQGLGMYVLTVDNPIDRHKYEHVRRALEHLYNWVEVYQRTRQGTNDPIPAGVELPVLMEE